MRTFAVVALFVAVAVFANDEEDEATVQDIAVLGPKEKEIAEGMKAFKAGKITFTELSSKYSALSPEEQDRVSKVAAVHSDKHDKKMEKEYAEKHFDEEESEDDEDDEE